MPKYRVQTIVTTIKEYEIEQTDPVQAAFGALTLAYIDYPDADSIKAANPVRIDVDPHRVVELIKSG